MAFGRRWRGSGRAGRKEASYAMVKSQTYQPRSDNDLIRKMDVKR